MFDNFFEIFMLIVFILYVAVALCSCFFNVFLEYYKKYDVDRYNRYQMMGIEGFIVGIHFKIYHTNLKIKGELG